MISPEKSRELAIELIAHTHLDLETLATSNIDAIDFQEHAVWCIRKALFAAYDAGLQAGRAS